MQLFGWEEIIGSLVWDTQRLVFEAYFSCRGQNYPAPISKRSGRGSILQFLIWWQIKSRTVTDASNIEAGFQTTINEHRGFITVSNWAQRRDKKRKFKIKWKHTQNFGVRGNATILKCRLTIDSELCSTPRHRAAKEMSWVKKWAGIMK